MTDSQKKKDRPPISMPVWKQLFAESGNVCAFTDCQAMLFRPDEVSDVQIAHVNAVSAGGARYVEGLTDSQLNATSNLLLMCKAHHGHIDQMPVSKYTEVVLREMKRIHARASRPRWALC